MPVGLTPRSADWRLSRGVAGTALQGFGFGLVLALLAPTASAQAPPAAAEAATPAAGSQQTDRALLERRVASVATLLDTSSGARQIETSGDPKAIEKRQEAKAVYKEALQALEAGDYPRANRLLSQTTGLMFDAVRLASPQQIKSDKQRDDYATRLESVKSLLAAQKRIAAEKANVKDAATTTAEIEKMLQQAEQLAADRKYGEAGATLDRAYLVGKAAIGSMRSGDTLVRSLNFANKEEEYKYELDRNETHYLLMRLLLDEKKGSEAMIQRFMEKAKELRENALVSAGKGNHAEAVKLLEDSTAELVKAIRNAGIFIPG